MTVLSPFPSQSRCFTREQRPRHDPDCSTAPERPAGERDVPRRWRPPCTDSTALQRTSQGNHKVPFTGPHVVFLVLLVFLLVGASLPVHAQAPLSLHDAIDRALHSPAAEVLTAQVDEARGILRQAGLGPNPRLFLQSEDIRPWADTYSFTTNTESYGYLSQTFEVDGKRRKRTALAEARLHETEATTALQRRQLAARVAQAYWLAVSQGRIIDLLREDMRAVDEMVEYHQKRVDAGAMRGVDLVRMEVERDRLSVALEEAQRDAAQARLELFRQMGQTSPAAGVQLTDTLEGVAPLLPPDVAVVLAHRPDVQAAQEAVATAAADLRLQQAIAKPDLDVLGGYKRNGADDTLFAGLQIPLPFRNRNQGEIERARAALRGAQAALVALQQQVRTEVEQARRGYEAQRNIVEQTLPAMRAHARQNLDIVREAYRLGGTDLLRFLDAERTEYDVEVSALRTLAQLQQSAVTLRLAEGVQP